MVLFADEGFLTSVTVAVVSVVGGALSVWLRYRFERQQRERELSDARQQSKHFEEEVVKLKLSMARLAEPLPKRDAQVDIQQLTSHVRQLADTVHHLREEVAELTHRAAAVTTLEATVQALRQQIAKLEQRISEPERRPPNRPDAPEPPQEIEQGDDPLPPWPAAPPAERKPIWFRGRVYRFVRFGGNNSRIETLNGTLDPLGELRDDRGAVSHSGTISNGRLFNDRHGRRPITSADHP